MPIRLIRMVVVFLTAAVPFAVSAPAQTEDESLAGRITYQDLSDLSDAAYGVRRLLDNHYAYVASQQAVYEAARMLEGTEIVFDAIVKQVTFEEVLVSVRKAGGAHVHIMPSPEEYTPCSYHTRHRRYPGPPSTQYYNILSAPQTLRIGSAIRLSDAKQLRKGDTVRLVAQVQRILIKIPAEFRDDAVVFLAHARVFYEDKDWLTQGVLR